MTTGITKKERITLFTIYIHVHKLFTQTFEFVLFYVFRTSRGW